MGVRFSSNKPRPTTSVPEMAQKSAGPTASNSKVEGHSTGELVWFITGTSSGLGRRLVIAALNKGDKVIATARNLDKVKDFPKTDKIRLLQVDVTDGTEVMKHKMEEAVTFFGRIDVVVNNAGLGVKTVCEEGGSAMLRKQYETNVFGMLDVTTAVLPYMRERKSGTVVIIGSRSTWRAKVPSIAPYASSKAAVHDIGEALSVELAPFSIRVLIVEPAVFKTEGIFSQPLYEDNKIPDYDDLRKALKEKFKTVPVPNDPMKGMSALVDVVRGEGKAKGKKWPLYLPLGPEAEEAIRDKFKVMDGVLADYRELIHDVRLDKEDESEKSM